MKISYSREEGWFIDIHLFREVDPNDALLGCFLLVGLIIVLAAIMATVILAPPH